MTAHVIPTLGSIGFFELRAPFDTKVVLNERYSCQAVRKISDYVANNEDVLSIYTDVGLVESDYLEAAKNDMFIASLQSDKGHWVYVPVDYIVKYPITNGIPYRSVSIAVALPSIPVNKDLTNLQTDIVNLIVDTLGVTPITKLVQTSRVVLVPKDKHDLSEANRSSIANGRTTDRSRYMKLLQDHQTALNKITELENYIKNNI